MQIILNFMFGFISITAVVSLVMAAARGIKHGIPKTMGPVVVGTALFGISCAWYWFVYFSGHEGAQPIWQWIADAGVVVRDVLHISDVKGFAPMMIMFLLRSFPFWLSLLYCWLAIRESDVVNAMVQAKVDAELKRITDERSAQYIEARRKMDGKTIPAVVNCDLTEDEVARYRMKSKRGGLTDEERAIWAQHLQKLQREGKWNPEENACNNRKVQKEKFDWQGAFVTMRKVLVTCTLAASVCVIATPYVSQFLSGDTPVDMDAQFGRDGFRKIVISEERMGEIKLGRGVALSTGQMTLAQGVTGCVHMESDAFPASLRKAVCDGYDRYIANGGTKSFEQYLYLRCGFNDADELVISENDVDDLGRLNGLILDFIHVYRAYQSEGGVLPFREWTIAIVTDGNAAMVTYIGACETYIAYEDYRNAGGMLSFKEWSGWGTNLDNKTKHEVEDLGTAAPASHNTSSDAQRSAPSTNSVSKPANSNQHQSAPAPVSAPAPSQPAPSKPAPSKPSQSVGSPDKVYPYGDGIPLDDGNGGYNDNPDGGGNGTWYDETTDMTPDRDSPLWNIPDSLF